MAVSKSAEWKRKPTLASSRLGTELSLRTIFDQRATQALRTFATSASACKSIIPGLGKMAQLTKSLLPKQKDLSSTSSTYEDKNKGAFWSMLTIPELGRQRHEDPSD